MSAALRIIILALLIILASLLAMVLIYAIMFRGTSVGYPAASLARSVENRPLPRVCLNNVCYAVELAVTPQERSRGLMFRQTLDEDKGMLFIFPQDDINSFWMKNTLIPLDIVWIDSNNKIIFISENTPPCGADPCPLYGPQMTAKYVLEVNAGQIKKINAKTGDEIIIK